MNQTLNRLLSAVRQPQASTCALELKRLDRPAIRLAVDLAQQPFDVGLREPLAKRSVEGREDAHERVGAVLQHRVRLLRGDAELALQKDDELLPCVRILKHEDGLPFRCAETAETVRRSAASRVRERTHRSRSYRCRASGPRASDRRRRDPAPSARRRPLRLSPGSSATLQKPFSSRIRRLACRNGHRAGRFPCLPLLRYWSGEEVGLGNFPSALVRIYWAA